MKSLKINEINFLVIATSRIEQRITIKKEKKKNDRSSESQLMVYPSIVLVSKVNETRV